MKRESTRLAIVTVAAATLFFGAAWGLRCAMRSSLFVLRVVEIADQLDDAPVDAATISNLAAVPVGTTHLFDLDLKPIEDRLMSNSWIKEVRLQKRFPQTLSIAVVLREPEAILQSENGSLSYIDSTGTVFGQVNTRFHSDLPVISGSQTNSTLISALKVIRAWNHSELTQAAQISSLQWDAERGFRVLAYYPFKANAQTPSEHGRSFGRTLVDLGQEIDGNDPSFLRLTQVFKYLSANHVQARQIWADSGKKVVVRTARGS